MSFIGRAADMNLTPVMVNGEPVSYLYTDDYSQIQYKELVSKQQDTTPYMGIFTRKTDNDNWTNAGVVSDNYKFIGNNVVLNGIRDSLSQINQQIYLENTMLNDSLTYMHQEIIIRNPQDIAEVGNIYPHIVVTNSYNGTAAITVNFGFSMIGNDGKISSSFSFRQKLAKMKQIHYASSKTTLSLAIGNYVQSFTDSIGELIQSNMAQPLSEEDMLKSLDLVEKLGKKRRDEVSTYLSSINPDGGAITVWKLFQAITKFSAADTNINAKKVLENVIERVLLVPQRMISSLTVINS